MANFVLKRGLEANIPSNMLDGAVYFCKDSGNLYFDYADSSNQLHRTKITAKYANQLYFMVDGIPNIIDPSVIITDSLLEAKRYISTDNYVTKIGMATTSRPGLMSKDDQVKLSGISSGANKTIVDDSFSSTSTNPVQNKTVKAALDLKADAASLDSYVLKSSVGATNGIAQLDSTGKVPSSQLPSYVDDVIEGYYANGKFYKESSKTNELAKETGKIYVDLTTNKTYRYGGTAFAVISETLAIGTTSSTAAAGDHTHSVVTVSDNGLMSPMMLGKLNSISNGADVNAINMITSNSLKVSSNEGTRRNMTIEIEWTEF